MGKRNGFRAKKERNGRIWNGDFGEEGDGADQEKTAERIEEGEADFPEKPREGGYRLTGSLTAKIVAFFLLAASCLVGLGGGLVSLYMGVEGFFTEKLNTVMLNMMEPECRRAAHELIVELELGNIPEAERLCRDRNLEMELIGLDNSEEEVIWSTQKGYGTSLTLDVFVNYVQQEKRIWLDGTLLEDGALYLIRVTIDPAFRCEDNLKSMAEAAEVLYENKYAILFSALGGIFLCLISFLFLMCSAGHRNGQEGIVPGALTSLHLDVLTAVFVGAALFLVYFLMDVLSYADTWVAIAWMTAAGTALAVWMTFYFMDFAIRVKRGKCWRYSLIFILLRGLGRILRFLGRESVRLVMGLPLILTTLNIYLGICILEFIWVSRYVSRDAGVGLWIMEKIMLLPFIMYIALEFRKLLKASRALAEGEEDYRVDTAGMFGVFREHGENLNSLGLGISKAVEERTKSERMKTELISNVSHDLKTPLTSIINYADLIQEEMNSAGEAPGTVDTGKVKEYAEVLLRQSRRLKKLMEDLMEASKATTGNMEVHLEPCEVGVLLSQAVGEYQQKMEEKALELITRQPEVPVTILADGRRLWRIFENLLNNICKYAQESSRVYLNVEVKEGVVLIIFRNMSKYPLDIPGEELEERFVRGDKSRHMEGNGLGLSIAKSLAELLNGQMEIVTDGDLFKVVLRFPLLPAEGGNTITAVGSAGGSHDGKKPYGFTKIN